MDTNEFELCDCSIWTVNYEMRTSRYSARQPNLYKYKVYICLQVIYIKKVEEVNKCGNILHDKSGII